MRWVSAARLRSSGAAVRCDRARTRAACHERRIASVAVRGYFKTIKTSRCDATAVRARFSSYETAKMRRGERSGGVKGFAVLAFAFGDGRSRRTRVCCLPAAIACIAILHAGAGDAVRLDRARESPGDIRARSGRPRISLRAIRARRSHRASSKRMRESAISRRRARGTDARARRASRPPRPPPIRSLRPPAAAVRAMRRPAGSRRARPRRLEPGRRHPDRGHSSRRHTHRSFGTLSETAS